MLFAFKSPCCVPHPKHPMDQVVKNKARNSLPRCFSNQLLESVSQTVLCGVCLGWVGLGSRSVLAVECIILFQFPDLVLSSVLRTPRGLLVVCVFSACSSHSMLMVTTLSRSLKCFL